MHLVTYTSPGVYIICRVRVKRNINPLRVYAVAAQSISTRISLYNHTKCNIHCINWKHDVLKTFVDIYQTADAQLSQDWYTKYRDYDVVPSPYFALIKQMR